MKATNSRSEDTNTARTGNQANFVPPSTSKTGASRICRKLVVQREKRLAPSALGDVWLGRISAGDELGRPVVVREMAASDLTPDERITVVMRGRALRKMRAHHLIRMLDVVEQNGSLVTVSEHLVAAPLLNILGFCIHNDCPLPPSVVARLILDATEAALCARELATSLGLSLNARLLLPEGIYVAEFGAVLLSEVGVLARIARCRRVSWRPSILSQLAPEELQLPHTFTEASEVYSLGVLMWELLANHRFLRAADRSEMCKQVLTQECPSLDRFASLSHPRLAPLVRLVRKATARSIEGRYKSLGELNEALKHLPSRLIATESEVAQAIRLSAGTLLDRARLSAEPRERVNVLDAPNEHDAATVPIKVSPIQATANTCSAQEPKREEIAEPPDEDAGERPTLRNCPKAKSVPPESHESATFEPVVPAVLPAPLVSRTAVSTTEQAPSNEVRQLAAVNSQSVMEDHTHCSRSSKPARAPLARILMLAVFALLASLSVSATESAARSASRDESVRELSSTVLQARPATPPLSISIPATAASAQVIPEAEGIQSRGDSTKVPSASTPPSIRAKFPLRPAQVHQGFASSRPSSRGKTFASKRHPTSSDPKTSPQRLEWLLR